jgi:NADPH2:quinone reductase
VLGVFWGQWVRHDQDAYKAAIGELAQWCAQGKLSCHVQQAYSLADTPIALKALADRKVMGKLVVHP